MQGNSKAHGTQHILKSQPSSTAHNRGMQTPAELPASEDTDISRGQPSAHTWCLTLPQYCPMQGTKGRGGGVTVFLALWSLFKVSPKSNCSIRKVGKSSSDFMPCHVLFEPLPQGRLTGDVDASICDINVVVPRGERNVLRTAASVFVVSAVDL